MTNPVVLGYLRGTLESGVKLVRPVLVRVGRRVMTAERWVALDGWEWVKNRGSLD